MMKWACVLRILRPCKPRWTRAGCAALAGATLVVVTLLTVLVAAEDGNAPVIVIDPNVDHQPSSMAPDEKPLPIAGPKIIRAHDRGSRFTHPGVLVSVQQLEFVRKHINAGTQPWASAFSSIRSSSYSSLSWKPKPRAVVDCGAYSNPDYGCRDEEADGVAAYTHALLWYFTLDRVHAEKAVEIIDAWSGTLQSHTNRNAPLQAGWSGASFVRAAEIMRHTYKGWPKSRADRAAAMFRRAFLPLLMEDVGTAGGNWELIMLDAAVGIAVFLDDRKLFNRAITKWRTRVKAYVYVREDGPYPKGPPGGPHSRAGIISFWFGQSRFVNGLTQETCRDFGHTAWGLSALAHVAETARIQGLDIYKEVQKRLVSALELHARYELDGNIPSWLCDGSVERGFRPSPEVAYNHYTSRLGLAMPWTQLLVDSLRPENAAFFYGWETLTHAR